MVTPVKKFTGKKLLLLGTNAGTCDMVNYARSQGAYVIVTDNLPPEKSAAKLIADETWQVSTVDVDTLEKLATQDRVSGIFAGVSEFNLEKALTLCERLGLPFYSTRQQWETCSNKRLFKQLCRDNNVPVAKEYSIDGNFREEDLRQIKYPVIVKPVDNTAGTGIGICRNKNELLRAYAKATSFSKTNRALVEEFIEGDEFLAAYSIKDGDFSLSYMIDRYFNLEPSETIPLPQAATLPSKYTKQYIKELNSKIIKMFQSIGLANGSIFIQGQKNNEGFYIFEANYRIDAILWYRITSKINGINFMEMLIDYALTGEMSGYDLSMDKPNLNKRCAVLSMVSKGGRVGKIIGLEKITNTKSLIAVEKMYDAGDYIERSGTLRQVHLRFHLKDDSIQELKNSIEQIQDTVRVLDDEGNNMLLPPFNINRI